MNDEPRKNEQSTAADELAGHIADAPWIGQQDSAPAPRNETLDAADARRLADLMLVEALAEQIHGRNRQATAERINRVMAALDDQQPATIPLPQPISRRRLLWWGPVGTAAAVLVGAFLLWSTTGGTNAMAAVQRALEQALALEDRAYRVVVERGDSSGPGDRLEAMLYVRGGDKFAIKHPAPLGLLWIGSNGGQSWFIPAVGPVLVSNDPAIVRKWTQKEGMSLPFLQVSTMLRRLQDRYELTLVRNEPEAEIKNPAWQHIRGVRRSEDTPGPRQIDLWVEGDSGVATEVLLQWPENEASSNPRRVTFTLNEQQPLPPDWFEHNSHHAAERPVLQWPRAE